MIKTPKKLIEVALPLDDINAACSREKSIRHGHPSTLHIWWARRPLAAARAVIFAQMVNDPGYQQGGGFKYGVNKKEAAIEREKLFGIIRDLVKWENTSNEKVLNRAREAIKKSWRETCDLNKDHPHAPELFDPNKLPEFHDPFAGGGAIPLEAQRLGLDSYASDLNPVAVIINKAMIEIPPKFAGRKPVGPIPDADKLDKKRSTKDVLENWSGANGLAEDVRRYGYWMREEAEKRIGHLYPKVAITPEMVKERPDLKQHEEQELTVIAWLWARTVKSPNPAFSQEKVPLVSSFILSSKKGKEAYVEPIVDGDNYRFEVRVGAVPNYAKHGTKASGRGANFTCLFSNTPIDGQYIKKEGQAGNIGQNLMAVVLDGKKGRIYVSPTASMVETARSVKPEWKPTGDIPARLTGGTCVPYGFKKWGDLFTPRQLMALTTFSDLVHEARSMAIKDAEAAGMADDGVGIDAGGTGATAYGDAVAVYLSIIVSKTTVFHNTIARWRSGEGKSAPAFGRQAIPMIWDYTEVNPFAGAGGDFLGVVNGAYRVFARLPTGHDGLSLQYDAQTQTLSDGKIVSTDPPYYDNIRYADLSDFFYVWLRRSLKPILSGLFATMAVPKAEELVANPDRHSSKQIAETFFVEGMTRAIHKLAEQAHPAFPVTIYYAFKQSETKEEGTASTGWEVFLEAIIGAGFAITGTWPMRTENKTRMISRGTNALASSIVLVCRKRDVRADSISRRELQRQLRKEMPEALEAMIGGSEGVSPIAPVDLAQAAIGPGMGIFSKYAAVLNQDGSKMSVHDALILINRAISDYVNPDSGSFDNDTLFCDSWFAEYGWSTGEFGQANVLAQAKGTTVDGVREAGVIESGSGKVRLLKWREYPTDWDPKQDNRTPVWEALHQLIRVLNQEGESGAGELLAGMPERGESIRQLAYHLYTQCDRKRWAEDARAYNELITSWHAIVAASHEVGQHDTQVQMELDS